MKCIAQKKNSESQNENDRIQTEHPSAAFRTHLQYLGSCFGTQKAPCSLW